MITKVADIRSIIYEYRENLAFIIGNDLSKGKELFLQYIGFEVVKLNTYDDIYISMLSIV